MLHGSPPASSLKPAGPAQQCLHRTKFFRTVPCSSTLVTTNPGKHLKLLRRVSRRSTSSSPIMRSGVATPARPKVAWQKLCQPSKSPSEVRRRRSSSTMSVVRSRWATQMTAPGGGFGKFLACEMTLYHHAHANALPVRRSPVSTTP